MPLSANGGSMRNILEILYSPLIREAYNLPPVNTICFLKSSEITTITFDGEEHPFYTAIGKLVEQLDQDAQFRVVPIREYAGDVPKVILDAAKEVGKANLILDLTAGEKDITGSLYTSACLAEIENTIYVDVRRDPVSRTFYTVQRSDKNILDKVSIIKFKSINEIERLASLNMKDFIFYKKYLESVIPDRDESTLLHFQNAIASYFKRDQDAYRNCIRDIGLINEQTLKRIADYLRTRCTPCVKSDKADLILLYSAQQRYEEIVRRSSSTFDDSAQRTLVSFFSHFPACFEMISMIRNYRNMASHNKGFTPCKDDAKLVIDTMLRICKSLSETEVT